MLVGQGPVGQPRKVPHERVELPLPLAQLLLVLPGVVDVVGVNHVMARYVMDSYNDQRMSASCYCAGARVAWPTYS
jgi:hypothetical protein